MSAHAGLNRIRFAGRVKGRPLDPGTYRISIRTPAGRVVRRSTLVVLARGAPTPAALQAMRSANTCPASSSGVGPSSTVGTQAGALNSDAQPQAAGIPVPHGTNVHSGVLGSAVEKTVRAMEPLLVALLALSILLLGAASLPREALPGPRVHDLLARHRLELAAAGAAALVAVAVAFVLT